MAKTQTAKRFTLNETDLKKIGMGAAVAVVGALLTYFSQAVADTDFGQLTPLVTALFAVFANAVRKYFEGK